MTQQSEKDRQALTSQPVRKSMWKLWLGIALFIVFVIGVNVEKHSKEGQARSAAAWRGAVQQIGDDVCDPYQWSQTPGSCEEQAKEARARAERRFEVYLK